MGFLCGCPEQQFLLWYFCANSNLDCRQHNPSSKFIIIANTHTTVVTWGYSPLPQPLFYFPRLFVNFHNHHPTSRGYSPFPPPPSYFLRLFVTSATTFLLPEVIRHFNNLTRRLFATSATTLLLSKVVHHFLCHSSTFQGRSPWIESDSGISKMNEDRKKSKMASLMG
ncbi:hypothetical protein CEXT_674871 [Caerostris extrusa]|uniref:Uncharacterized protein n=1 Tax=Caerostris extrusa TaxID=172846 RepID=A0AAV4MMN8_CAEEX|nr:hypothetical protein CEXT_674871 [Caerostris extrusa]